MVRSEQGYNSFQIIRPVQQTTELQRFLTIVDALGKQAFGNGLFEMIEGPKRAVTQGEEFEELVGEITQGVGVGVAKHEVYGRHGLKLPLLDRRSPKTYKAQALMRAKMRFDKVAEASPRNKREQRRRPLPVAMPLQSLNEAALRHDIPDAKELKVRFNNIIPVFDPATELSKGVEFALVPDSKQPETLLLYDEAAICLSAFANLYQDLAFPASKTTCQVSFMRTPEMASDDEICTFIESVEERLPLTLTLDAIRPKFND